MNRYVMKLAYDGTRFYGWQVQHQERTVQHVLELALSEFCGKKTSVTGSGRTDAGVHALGQFAHFNYKGNASPEQIRKGIRRFLPDDIKVIQIFRTTPDFHARYDAYERIYQYIIAKSETPFNRLYQGYFPRKKITPIAIQAAAKYFIGEHDFSSFSKLNPSVPDHVCSIYQSSFEEHEDSYVYCIRANRFLHNMVRRIVGALVNVSHMDLDPTIVSTWLEQKQSKQTIIFPAPPQGLYLKDVLYPENKILQ